MEAPRVNFFFRNAVDNAMRRGLDERIVTAR